MTFDDGILEVYRLVNKAEPGNKPNNKLELKERFYFGYAQLGYNRVYTAMKAGQQIAAVVCVPGWNNIQALDVCVMEGGQQFKIRLAQPEHDEDGLRITKLSLERTEEEYEIER